MRQKDVTIVGLGPGEAGQLPLENWERISKAEKVLLQTSRHPVVNWLKKKNINYTGYDDYYLMSSTFGQAYVKMADSVVKEAQKQPVVFGVPGHPLVAEPVVEFIQKKAGEKGLEVEMLPAMSFLDNLYRVLGIETVTGCRLVDGMQLSSWNPDKTAGYIIYNIYDRAIALAIKEELVEYYPGDHPVTVIRAAGIEQDETVETVSFDNLGSIHWYDHFTSLYIPPVEKAGARKGEGKSEYPLDPLVDVMARLRGENGCPWDLEQTHRTLIPYLLEETYEVLDALEEGDMYKLCEELGDLLLQVVFHAQIARENNNFDINQVIESITQKLVRRHPHVFGDVTVDNSSQVLNNWEKIKQGEKDGGEEAESVLSDIPKNLPALLKAEKVQNKAARVGFDWPDLQGPLQKIEEERQELINAYRNGNLEETRDELGDLTFAIVNLSRFLGVNAETALNNTVEKFIRRFKCVEEKIAREGKHMEECSLEELDKIWDKIKTEENLK